MNDVTAEIPESSLIPECYTIIKITFFCCFYKPEKVAKAAFMHVFFQYYDMIGFQALSHHSVLPHSVLPVGGGK